MIGDGKQKAFHMARVEVLVKGKEEVFFYFQLTRALLFSTFSLFTVSVRFLPVFSVSLIG